MWLGSGDAGFLKRSFVTGVRFRPDPCYVSYMRDFLDFFFWALARLAPLYLTMFLMFALMIGGR